MATVASSLTFEFRYHLLPRVLPQVPEYYTMSCIGDVFQPGYLPSSFKLRHARNTEEEARTIYRLFEIACDDKMWEAVRDGLASEDGSDNISKTEAKNWIIKQIQICARSSFRQIPLRSVLSVQFALLERRMISSLQPLTVRQNSMT
ncbi:MAG: hypothetical protein AAGA53_12560 [Pseudomonadota bacterium]